MSETKKIERVGLYFNLEIESEARMWEYLKGKKKSYEIKKSLERSMRDDNEVAPVPKTSEKEVSISGPEFKILNNAIKEDIEDAEGIQGF